MRKNHPTECASWKPGVPSLTERKRAASFNGISVDTNTRALHTSVIELDWK